MDRTALNSLTDKIIGACIEIHRALGPGRSIRTHSLESAYERCLCHELALQNLNYVCQLSCPVSYKGTRLDCGYRLDLVVKQQVIVELKTVESFLPVHHAQLLTYLKLTGLPLGLLINFRVPVLRVGIRRIAN